MKFINGGGAKPRCKYKMLQSGNHLNLIGEDDKIFNLHLLMAFNFILNLAGRISLSSSISNLRKPVFNATCAVSVFYANWRYRRIEDKRRHHKDKAKDH
ncbi:hypothetical protein T09_10141 [Trichinella sp. T9]|nr:hypothetical protein T09_10141 [Trichinella sp. T9]